MPNNNRLERINEEIQKELAQQLRSLKDPRVQKTIVSITRVQTTPDLRASKIFVSFLDKDAAPDAIRGLRSASGYLRRALGASLNLRYTPELIWQPDDSITHGAHILDLLSKLDIPEESDDEQPADEN